MRHSRFILWSGMLFGLAAISACKGPASSSPPGMPGMPSSPSSLPLPGLPSTGSPSAPGLPSTPGLPSPSIPSIPSGSPSTPSGLPSTPSGPPSIPSGSSSAPSPVSLPSLPSPSGSPSTPDLPGDNGTRPGSSDDGQGRPGDDGWESSNEDTESTGTGSGDESERDGRPDPGDSRGDSELDKALEIFDDEILSERAAILARRNETAGQQPLPEAPNQSGESVEDTGSVEEDNPRRSDTPSNPPTILPVPPDVADAKDDNVVCRQIREAAVAESDTDLREALWEEYRRCRDRR